MFILLFYFLFNMNLTCSSVIIQNAGLNEIKSDDMAMIFFVTVENTYDCKISVSINSVECIEGDPYSETANYMYLLGADMDHIDKKRTKNLTLIYPNLYLRNRVGKCIIMLHYQTGQTVEEITKEVYFQTDKAFVEADQEVQRCSTYDLDGSDKCIPVDCPIKYSSRRSYFNKENKLCQAVPECPPNTVYIPKSNICRKLHEPVCKSDLEMIEDGFVEKCHSVSNLVTYRCHHGSTNNQTEECVCNEGWITSTCLEGAYHPTLNLYHMCNIEINSWERANRAKLIMTIVVLVILALAIAAKMLLAVCVLNWCCHFIRSKNKTDSDETYDSYNIPYSYCGDEICVIGENIPEEKSSRTIRVSFSNIDAISSADDTDVTVSVDANSKSSNKPSQNSLNVCHCK